MRRGQHVHFHSYQLSSSLRLGDCLLGFPAFRVTDQLVEEADTAQVRVDVGAVECKDFSSAARSENGGTPKGSAPLIDGVEVLDLVETAWEETVDRRGEVPRVLRRDPYQLLHLEKMQTPANALWCRCWL